MSNPNWGITVGLREPDNGEEIVGKTDFNAMRAAITKGQRDSALIAHVTRQAEVMGLNGEDRYTALAYHALLALERHAQRALEISAKLPNPATIVGAREHPLLEALREIADMRFSDGEEMRKVAARALSKVGL